MTARHSIFQIWDTPQHEMKYEQVSKQSLLAMSWIISAGVPVWVTLKAGWLPTTASQREHFYVGWTNVRTNQCAVVWRDWLRSKGRECHLYWNLVQESEKLMFILCLRSHHIPVSKAVKVQRGFWMRSSWCISECWWTANALTQNIIMPQPIFGQTVLG